MALERLQPFKVICEGGLDSNQNYLQLSDRTPGVATTLINFEPSLFGGYRRLEGFDALEEDFPEVDLAGAEGKILGVSIYVNDIIAARKTQSVTTYKFYAWSSGGAWSAYTTGLTLTATGVNRIRHTTYNFDGDDHISFADGVNGLILFDGTNWAETTTGATGADFANAGGDQLLPAPKYVCEFKNHIFIAGDATDPHIVAHSAPTSDYDWDVASGAGQLNAGFIIKQIKPFRDELFIFGETKIKKIVVEGTDFVIKDVSKNVGCLAPDSVVEINGDLLFISQDGVRTVAATERNNDVELGVMSKSIQQDINNLMLGAEFNTIDAVVIRRKSQVRFFFSDENLATAANSGIIGGLRAGPNGVVWEWGLLRGIRTSCSTSGYIGATEYVLHGDFNGKVYRQESGFSFDGANITAVYTTPYYDMGDTDIRKTIHKVTLFLRPEDFTLISAAMQFDWDSKDIYNPLDNYLFEQEVSGVVYGDAIYDTSLYASAPVPVIAKNVEGSGNSVRLTFTSSDTDGSYSIQGIVFEMSINGRK